MNARAIARLALITLVLAALLLIAGKIDLTSARAAIAGLHPGWVALAIAVVLGAKLGAKVVRSQRALDDVAGSAAPRWPSTARLLIASHAAGQLAWAPLGFTVRTIALGAHGLSLGAIARVHVLERVAEAAALAAIAALALACAPHAAGAMLAPGVTTVIALAALAILAIVAATSRRARRAFTALRADRRTLAHVSAWSIVAGAADVAVVALALAAAGQDPLALGLAPPLLAVLALNLACAVPVVPAQLGVQEAAIVLALAPAGVSTPAALAAALAYRAAHVVPLVLVGLPALASLGALRLRVRAPRPGLAAR
ncbi:MAG: lysylphosphatidylglycerol synthase domain-containing protein [Deltaproteobacteria bacterium]|nr:lysylphosphatidylglycerol synthase domain-containing protein [Deltaproteobacteria bacterium]